MTAAFLRSLGVADVGPATSPFDPGYDPATLASHLDQSHHLISILKLSMACWLIADEKATRAKIAAARAHGVRTTAGGGPFEIAVRQGRLEEYLELCAEIGLDRIECGEGFTQHGISPVRTVELAARRGLEVQFELGEKHSGAFGSHEVDALIDDGRRWLDAGAVELVIEARESARGVGLFDATGEPDWALAERFVGAFGLGAVTFEAPNKASQFAMLNHFGPSVHLSNVRLEELLRVEIYRRGLHSDAFDRPNLSPTSPGSPHEQMVAS